MKNNITLYIWCQMFLLLLKIGDYYLAVIFSQVFLIEHGIFFHIQEGEYKANAFDAKYILCTSGQCIFKSTL